MSSLLDALGTLRVAANGWSVEILDQTRLPHELAMVTLSNWQAAAEAIVTMQVRGAPLIGVTAAYGLALALHTDPSDTHLDQAASGLLHTRPTAVNLRWALETVLSQVRPLPSTERATAAYALAARLAESDRDTNHAIGVAGLEIFRSLASRKNPDEPLRVMTHCNAGALATLGWGTATAPMYLAQQAGLPIHVWVSETRPRNQGAALTAWELGQAGIPLTVIADNAAGHLMQRGLVDVVIVGADRVTSAGDAANKIGTYLKALAAHAHDIPFYVAFPGTTIDWTISDGVRQIPIEQRSAREVTHQVGRLASGARAEVALTPEGTAARNDGFDVTPARYITGLITERGICQPTTEGLRHLYPEATR